MQRSSAYIASLFILGNLACSATKNGARGGPQVPVQIAETYNKDSEAKGDEAKDSESVTPPSNVSGTYLFCEDTANSANEANKVIVKCALREEKSDSKVDMVAAFQRYEWNAADRSGSKVSVNVAELFNDPEWHALYTLTANSLADIEKFKKAKSMAVEIEERSGSIHRFASLGTLPYRWLPLNGGVIPVNAVAGGTEQKGIVTSFLCRSYVKGQVMPGKLISVVAGDARSVCYTADAGVKQKSSDDGDGRLQHFSDVLVLDAGSFDELWEWVPGTAGSKPALAMMSGVDAFGLPIFTCRALAFDSTINSPEGEQTPGLLRIGSSTCTHEFFGQQDAENYQVLAWKSAVVKAMFERTDN